MSDTSGLYSLGQGWMVAGGLGGKAVGPWILESSWCGKERDCLPLLSQVSLESRVPPSRQSTKAAGSPGSNPGLLSGIQESQGHLCVTRRKELLAWKGSGLQAEIMNPGWWQMLTVLLKLWSALH